MSRTTYLDCPNGCSGEVPMSIETDGPDPTVGLGASAMTAVDERANAESHDDGCPPLTDDQKLMLQDQADAKVNDPEYGLWNGE